MSAGETEKSEMLEEDEENEEGLGEEVLGEEGLGEEEVIGEKGQPLSSLSDKSTESRSIIIVPSEDQITSNKLTLGEVARVIALMAKIIEQYPGDYANEDETDPIAIAKKLLLARKIPFKLHREMGVTAKNERIVEELNIRDMAYPAFN